MTVAGVFAKAKVGDAGHRELRIAGGAKKAADDVVFIKGHGSRGILLLSINNAKDEERAKTLLGSFLEPVEGDIDRHLEHARHRCHFRPHAGSFPHKHRYDDVAAAKGNALKHATKLRLHTQAPGANGKIQRLAHKADYNVGWRMRGVRSYDTKLGFYRI